VEWKDPVEKIPFLDPYTSVACWVVFWLTKSEFEGMRRLEVTYRGLGQLVDVEISPFRRSSMTYLKMIRPYEGQQLAALRSIKFRLVEQYIPFDWSIQIDGRLVFAGRAEPELHWLGSFQFACPVTVDVPTHSLNLGPGQHDLVVYASDGTTTETVSASFFIQPGHVEELSTKWVLNVSGYFSGMVFARSELSGQTVYDIDGDGLKEIIFSTLRGASGRLWCFDSGLRLEWVYPEMGQDGLLGPTSKVSLVDVDSDGVHEICFTSGGRLHILNRDGYLLWAWDNPRGRPMRGAPQAYDIDGDGLVEFFLQDDLGYLFRIDHEGSLVATTQIGKGMMQPTIADIDGDGEYEVLAAGGDALHCFRANDFYEKWRYHAAALMDASQIIVADIDSDREYEALTWSSAPGSVICVSHSGEEVWRWRLPGDGVVRFCQAVGDLDKDGSMDMVVMSHVGIFRLDVGGESPVLKWEVNLTRWSADGLIPDGAWAHYWSSNQLIADIDGDGRLEVLLLVPFPIVVDAATGVLKAYYFNEHLLTGIPRDNGAWWGDVDGDGRSEWICELIGWTHAKTMTYCLTLDGVFPAESPWPEYWHSALPASDQLAATWLTLKGAYSNSVWFPIREGSQGIVGGIVLTLLAITMGKAGMDCRR